MKFSSIEELKTYVNTIDIEELDLDIKIEKYLPVLENWGWGENYRVYEYSPFSSDVTIKAGGFVDMQKVQHQAMMLHKIWNLIPFWIKLTTYSSESGAVIFLKNLHMIFPEMCQEIVDEIKNKLGVEFPLNSVGILKAEASVDVHQDLPLRTGCINIFIKNGEAANFNCFKSHSAESKYKSINTKTGSSYLINTSSWHAVEKILPGTRYAFTISIQ